MHDQFLERSKQYIAHGALTNSKRTHCFVEGVYPTHVSHGAKCYLTDTYGRKYIDFICALGTNYFGYGNHHIAQACYSALFSGANLSLSSTKEVEVAEKFCSLMKLDKLRFLMSGTEACMAAVRFARAYKQSLWPKKSEAKFTVLTDGYHGWADEFIANMEPAYGLQSAPHIQNLEYPLNESQIAAADVVIIEPVIIDNSAHRIEYLCKLQDLCKKHNTVLIFDETITGFRYKDLAVYLHHKLDPDLVVFGKAIGGGMPLSIVAGKKHIMDTEVFVSGSHFGNRVSIAALDKAIDLISDRYHPNILWQKSAEFIWKFNLLNPDVQLVGYPTRGIFKGDKMAIAIFWQEAIKSGVLFGPSYFIYPDLVAEFENLEKICETIFIRMKFDNIKLEGKLPQPSIIQKVRNL